MLQITNPLIRFWINFRRTNVTKIFPLNLRFILIQVYTSESLYAPVRGLNITDCTVPCNYKQLRKLRHNIAVTKSEWEDKCEKGPEPEKIPK